MERQVQERILSMAPEPEELVCRVREEREERQQWEQEKRESEHAETCLQQRDAMHMIPLRSNPYKTCPPHASLMSSPPVVTRAQLEVPQAKDIPDNGYLLPNTYTICRLG